MFNENLDKQLLDKIFNLLTLDTIRINSCLFYIYIYTYEVPGFEKVSSAKMKNDLT